MRGRAGLPQVAAEVQRDIAVARGLLLRSVRSKPQTGVHSLQHQRQKGTQITSSCEKQKGFCLLGRDGQRCRKPLKGPTHKISFAATYAGLQQREGRVQQRHMRRV